jgi:hypothetical protein
LKTFQANGCFGMSVLTSITAQNTVRVTRAFDLPVDLILDQLEAVFEDLPPAAAKTGMLSSPGIVDAVVSFWRKSSDRPPLVVDPVMISKGGHPLLSPDAVARVRRDLPLAALVTPTVKRSSRACPSLQGRRAGGRPPILDLGVAPRSRRGTRRQGSRHRATDFLFQREGIREYAAPGSTPQLPTARLRTRRYLRLARAWLPEESVARAKRTSPRRSATA